VNDSRTTDRPSVAVEGERDRGFGFISHPTNISEVPRSKNKICLFDLSFPRPNFVSIGSGDKDVGARVPGMHINYRV
jgi:hypothetical protein